MPLPLKKAYLVYSEFVVQTPRYFKSKNAIHFPSLIGVELDHRAWNTNFSLPGAEANASLQSSTNSVPSSPDANVIVNFATSRAATILNSISPMFRPTHPYRPRYFISMKYQ